MMIRSSLDGIEQSEVDTIMSDTRDALAMAQMVFQNASSVK